MLAKEESSVASSMEFKLNDMGVNVFSIIDLHFVYPNFECWEDSISLHNCNKSFSFYHFLNRILNLVTFF